MPPDRPVLLVTEKRDPVSDPPTPSEVVNIVFVAEYMGKDTPFLGVYERMPKHHRWWTDFAYEYGAGDDAPSYFHDQDVRWWAEWPPRGATAADLLAALGLERKHIHWAADHNEQGLEADKEREAAGRLNRHDHRARADRARAFRAVLARLEADEREEA